MKANQKTWSKNDRAEVGVGTLIVFIAMVLVAAVAAAVLISTGGDLQQRAQATGKEATQEVSSNLKVLGIYGIRNDTAETKVWDLALNVELSAGALPMDLTKLVIRFSDGSYVRHYEHSEDPLANGAAASDYFEATWIRGQGFGYVAQSGDLIQIHINNVNLNTRHSVELLLIPESGAPVSADFRTPPTYSTWTTISFR